ncbi:MAG: hypothetical protein ABSG65_27990 [Bryobacteraceae bacterium]|jgi:hypothetical protein
MAQSAAVAWHENTAARRGSVPWYIWACAVAVTSASFGGVWDISWHESIGRDTFWTAPHLFIHFGGILAGAASAWLIFHTTLSGSPAERAGAVRIWGFLGPLGAFLCCWGGVAMVSSAPFDNWWHAAYGLDVKILSPPHVVLIFGLMAIRFGAVILILGEMNRADGVLRRKLEALLIYMFTYLLGMAIAVFQEYTFTDSMHSGLFYLLMSLFTPMFLVVVAQVSQFRWAGTAIAGIFTTLNLLFLWLLPLFPAEPKLGPVYHHVTRFIPPPFPLLILAPAVALDLLRPRLRNWGGWRRSAVLGAVFLAVFAAAQWPFANFLQSPAARNWVFGTQYFPFFVPLDDEWVRYVFTQVEGSAAEFWFRMALALATAILSARAGLSLGAWMRCVRR